MRTTVADIQGGSGQLEASPIRKIKVLLVVYVYDTVQDTFKQVPGIPAHIPLQIHNAMKALQMINEGSACIVCMLSEACASNVPQMCLKLVLFGMLHSSLIHLKALLLAIAGLAAGEHGMLQCCAKFTAWHSKMQHSTTQLRYRQARYTKTCSN